MNNIVDHSSYTKKVETDELLGEDYYSEPPLLSLEAFLRLFT